MCICICMYVCIYIYIYMCTRANMTGIGQVASQRGMPQANGNHNDDFWGVQMSDMIIHTIKKHMIGNFVINHFTIEHIIANHHVIAVKRHVGILRRYARPQRRAPAQDQQAPQPFPFLQA